MALTEDQMNQRSKSIGGSDVPAILGISPFKSAGDVFVEKTQRVEQVSSPAMEAGHMLESAVVNWSMERLQIDNKSWSSANVRRTKYLTSEGRGVPAHANLDFMFLTPEIGRCGLEAKTTSAPYGWGEQGTDEVPSHILAQCLWQAMVAELNIVYIGVLIADRGFHMRMYEVDPEQYEEECQDIRQRVVSFWNDNVMEDKEPEDTYPTMDTLNKVIRTPNKSVEINEDDVKMMLAADEEVKIAKQRQKLCREKVLNSMKDAEEGQCSLGRITYLTYERKGYKVNPTEYRQMKWKSQRKE